MLVSVSSLRLRSRRHQRQPRRSTRRRRRPRRSNRHLGGCGERRSPPRGPAESGRFGPWSVEKMPVAMAGWHTHGAAMAAKASSIRRSCHLDILAGAARVSFAIWLEESSSTGPRRHTPLLLETVTQVKSHLSVVSSRRWEVPSTPICKTWATIKVLRRRMSMVHRMVPLVRHQVVPQQSLALYLHRPNE